MHDKLIREAFETYAGIFRKYAMSDTFGGISWQLPKAERIFLHSLRRCQRRRRRAL